MGGCWCVGFHPEGFSRAREPGGNRQAKRDLVEAGRVQQVLVYDDGECVGWCQYGRPDEVARIKNRQVYEAGLGELPAWRIGCNE